MPSETKPAGADRQDKAPRRGSGISALPEQQRKRGAKADAAKSRRGRKYAAGGPGGLGYLLGLDEDEQTKIDWHPDEADAKAPPRRS
ncbi:MAG: hypothetical protein KF849_06785 [Rhizobiaceae bacterium]|nr:hypothetical protein [Rhizobiaceae bacterium]